ncbi:cubilin, partial [Patella vulgata]|uniref:cubilin n=1 Tax=Patella vulgata TaxID=6465 RepID=UPI0024A88E18
MTHDMIYFVAGAQCGGELTEDQGIVISPNYPNAYTHNAQCVWTIRVTPGDTISLTFTNMDLESQASCRYDFVEVRDGDEQTSPVIGKYCGTNIPSVLSSSSNVIWIMFKSDASQRGSGFRATWEAACGGTFTESSGTLQSPSYPNSYPHNKECVYLINQPAGYRVVLTFSGFDIEGATSAGSCNYNYVEIRNGGGADSPVLGKFCGTQVPAVQQSTQNLMWIKFKTDGSVSNNGFQATFTREEAVCGEILTDTTGSLTSPGHPNPYPHGANCTWHITVTPGYIIRLTFHSFYIESDICNCRRDYVQIYDKAMVNTSSSLGRFCGSVLPPVLTSTSNTMTVRFGSDSSIAHEGFSASYLSLNASTLCGAALTDTFGVITSPNYPGNYPHQRECIWTISVPDGNQILLNVTDFLMESHVNCNYDYLEIRNGGYQTSPLVGKYCGRTIDNIIVSHSNRMWLKFKTDVSQSARGFKILYDGTSTGCGADLTSSTGSFISPNYPMTYAHNSECFWTITINQGNTITLTFADFDLEAQHNCHYDYLMVREGNEYGEKRGKFCGTPIPSPIQSRTNKLWIKFRADFSAAGRGFQATYVTNCNTRLTSHDGVIESPNFPNSYPHIRNCTWVIQTTMGNKINASFSHFDLEGSATCSYDYLQLFDGNRPTSNSIGRYCGNTIPPSISTNGSSLSLNLVTDQSVAGNGFRLEWITDGCGGELFTATGTFTSPNYPNAYPNRRECIWKITVGTGKSIQLTINPFDLESHSNCNYDVLDIYGGPDDSAPRIAHLCHTKTTPQVVQTTGNTMFVRFKSDSRISGTGFSATYQSQTGGCGGNFSTPSGTIVSKNYPSNYPHNTDCQWLITVEENQPVVITFNDFDVEGSSTCNYDYVAIYDGWDTSFPELVKHCGTSLPIPSVYRSSNNQVYIRLRSDGDFAARGFKASYVTSCGGRKNSETDGAIMSTNYPQAYDRNSNCTWLIKADHNSDRITLTFTHMDVEQRGSGCNHDYLRVLDGNDVNSPEIGTYCGTTVPAPITSQGSAMFVVFISDGYSQSSGFRATYTKSASSCGGVFTAQSGSFTSPSYPNSYPAATECVWTIQSSPGNSILISFSVFNIESSPSCVSDYVEIRQVNAAGSLIGRYCGSSIPSNVTTANGIWMKFRSNNLTTGTGFVGEYNSVFGGDLSGSSGQISSPLYPGRYPHSSDSTWKVTAPVGMRIRISFTAFNVEGPRGSVCVWNYVKILDGGASDSPELIRYCGSNIPDPIISTSNQMQVVFHTDRYSNGNGFLLNWQATSDVPISSTTPAPGTTQVPGCGGTLYATHNAQTLQSPGYPGGYP